MWNKKRKPVWKPEVESVIAGALSREWQNRLDKGVQSPVGEHIDAFASVVADAISYEFEERESRIAWLEQKSLVMQGIISHLSLLHRPRQNKGANNATKLDNTTVFRHDTPIRRVCQECSQNWPCATYEAIKKVEGI